MLINTIEDLVLFICDPINGFDPKSLEPRDRSILFSIASQLRRSLSLTNKQADLVIKIIKDNSQLYGSISNLNFLLDYPNYKYPFRVIDVSRKIMLDEKNQFIYVKFPFDQQINKSLEKVNARRNYDTVNRAHVYKLSENAISSLVRELTPHDFEIDEKILAWYKEIKEISETPGDYIPSADIENDIVVLKNSNNSLKNYFEQHRRGDVTADAYLAKFMGLHISQSLINEITKQRVDNLTKTIISDKMNKFVISSSSPYDKFNISAFLRETKSYPVLILVNDDDNLPTVFKQWIIALNKSSIENKDISVLFRSDHRLEFNNMVKEEHLNNLVGENTKVVFVKNKIPKILYKLDFKPKLVISSNSFYVHYTGQKLVDSHPLVIYYTEESVGRINNKFAKL